MSLAPCVPKIWIFKGRRPPIWLR